MGVGAILGGVGSLVGIGSSIAGMANGAPSTGTYGGNPNVYIPGNQPGADALYQSIFSQMAPYASSLPSQLIPQYQQYAQSIQTNPYAQTALGGAGGAAGYAMGTLEPQLQAASGSLYNMGASTLPYVSALNAAGEASIPYANQILSTGFDPQSSLYNQLQQQTLDQSNATNSMYGLGSSPYGAGVANQNLSGFNINWQNQQLQRELQAAQGYGSILNAPVQALSGASNIAGQGFTGAYNLGSDATSTLANSSALPSQAYLGIQQQGLGALNSLVGGYNSSFGPGESLANLLQSYLGLGQSATGLAQAGQAQQFSQNQTLGQNLSTALTNPQLAQLFNGISSGGDQSYTPTYDYGLSQQYPTAYTGYAAPF